MGTLGCINDMMRRDKENRELRKQNRARMQDTHQRLLEIGKGRVLPDISPESVEEIRKKTNEKESLDRERLFRAKLVFLLAFLAVGILVWLVIWFL